MTRRRLKPLTDTLPLEERARRLMKDISEWTKRYERKKHRVRQRRSQQIL